jgi:hypothetical protein
MALIHHSPVLQIRGAQHAGIPALAGIKKVT